MATKIASKQKRIQDIASMLDKGLERKEILQRLSKTCKVSARTLDNEIKEAKLITEERRNAAEAIRIASTKQMTEDAIREGLKSDLEIEVILCQIAGGGVDVEEWVNGLPVIRKVTPSEIINAAKTIFLKRGSNAPTKIAATDKAGNDVSPSINITQVVSRELPILENE